MNHSDLAIIEKYFCDELSEEEKAAFEQRRSADAVFRQEVADVEKTIRFVQLDGRKTLQKRLAERGRQLDTEKNSPAHRQYLWWGVAALILALLCWWLFTKKTETTKSVPSTGSDTADTTLLQTPGADSTIPSIRKLRPEDAHPPIAYGQKDKTSSSYVRGKDDKPDALDTLVASVWETRFRADGSVFNERHLPVARQLEAKNFTDAYVALQLLEPSDTLDFLKGYCLLELREGGEALRSFSRLKNGKPWQPAADWYTVLANLLEGERAAALSQAKNIANKKNHPFRRQAATVVKELK